MVTGEPIPAESNTGNRIHPWESMARHMKKTSVSQRFFGFAYIATGEA